MDVNVQKSSTGTVCSLCNDTETEYRTWQQTPHPHTTTITNSHSSSSPANRPLSRTCLPHSEFLRRGTWPLYVQQTPRPQPLGGVRYKRAEFRAPYDVNGEAMEYGGILLIEGYSPLPWDVHHPGEALLPGVGSTVTIGNFPPHFTSRTPSGGIVVQNENVVCPIHPPT